MVMIAAQVAEGPALYPGLLSSDPALFILFASFYKKKLQPIRSSERHLILFKLLIRESIKSIGK